MCQISVVTSVYNCEEYIGETIQSVIDQTFTDWEFIIINDCSKDKSADIIRSFHDDRIRFVDNKVNRGQCANLNWGISQARGKYIARLDHDDICYPERFQKQFDYMENHPDVVLCGSWLDFWQDGQIIEKECPKIVGSKELMFSLGFANYCLAHSSFMIKKSALIDNNVWYGQWQYAEDYDLLLKMLKVGKIDYIHEQLITYRIFPEQFTQTCSGELIQNEEDELRTVYFNSLNLGGKEILQKAALRGMRTMKEYKQFNSAIIQYAGYCGLHCSRQELADNECFKTVYHDVCMKQQYNCVMLLNYIMSPYENSKWLFTGKGLRFIIKCLIHYHHK